MKQEYEQLALFDVSTVLDIERAGGPRDALEPGWRRQALGVIGRLARNRGQFSVDDVRRVIGEPDSPHQWGPVFLTAQRVGLIEAVDVRPSGSRSRHAGLVHVWRGTDRTP